MNNSDGWHEDFEKASRVHLARFGVEELPKPIKFKKPCLDAAEGGCGWPNMCDNCKDNTR